MRERGRAGRVPAIGWAAAGLVAVAALAPAGVRAQAADTAAVAPGDTLRLGLAEAVQMAAGRSLGVEVARQAAQEAQAKVAEERADLLPQVNGTFVHGDRTFNTASFGISFPSAPGEPPLFDPNGEVLGPVTTIDARAHLSQTLFDWSALEQLKSARAAFSASQVQTDVARERAGAGAAAAYVAAARAEGALEARQADVAMAQELVGVAQDLLDSGVGVRIDVTRAQAQLATMQAQLLAARSGAERTRLALLRTLNLPLGTPVALVDTLGAAGSLAGQAADTLVAAALARRPDVQALDRRIAVARLDVSAVKAERLPTLSVVANDGVNGSTYPHLLNTYEWSFQVSVPVFDGLRRGARADAARARLTTLETQRRELEEQVAFDVRDALLQAEAARQQVAASQARLRLAEEELSEARDRFQAGVAGSADVINASLRLNEARTAEVDARAAWQAARVALAVARGAVTDLR